MDSMDYMNDTDDIQAWLAEIDRVSPRLPEYDHDAEFPPPPPPESIPEDSTGTCQEVVRHGNTEDDTQQSNTTLSVPWANNPTNYLDLIPPSSIIPRRKIKSEPTPLSVPGKGALL